MSPTMSVALPWHRRVSLDRKMIPAAVVAGIGTSLAIAYLPARLFAALVLGVGLVSIALARPRLVMFYAPSAPGASLTSCFGCSLEWLCRCLDWLAGWRSQQPIELVEEGLAHHVVSGPHPPAIPRRVLEVFNGPAQGSGRVKVINPI